MKIKRFEEFLNESKTNNVKGLILHNISDIDHTRIIKWLGFNWNYGDYSVKKQKDGSFMVDTSNVSSSEINDFTSYLSSNKYEYSINESASINEAGRVGRTSWKNILSDLEDEGWHIDGRYAVKFFGDEKQIKITKGQGDEIEYEVLDANDKVEDSGSFDAEGLSAGELNSEVWNYVDEDIEESTKINEYERNVSPENLEKVVKALPELEKLIEKYGKFKVKLQAKIESSRSGDFIRIYSDELSSLLSPLAKTVFAKFNIYFWGGQNTQDGNIWFNPKVSYEHPGGGSNGTDFIWDSLWFDVQNEKWIEGRKFI